jgi:hypothetical protein
MDFHKYHPVPSVYLPVLALLSLTKQLQQRCNFRLSYLETLLMTFLEILFDP